jgi:hypothetical protein
VIVTGLGHDASTSGALTPFALVVGARDAEDVLPLHHRAIL